MLDQKTFEIIEKIAKEHSKVDKRKPFGYLDRDDLKSEIWAICLDKLKDFDYSRGELEHFLRVSVKNRLVNRYKDITKSVRSPCPRCPYFKPDEDPDCGKFGVDRHLCNKWRNYQLSVESRNSLLNASEPQSERYTQESVLDKLSAQEIYKFVASRIDKNYRRDLEQVMSGGKISKQRLKKLKREIVKVLNNTNSQLTQLTVRGKNA